MADFSKAMRPALYELMSNPYELPVATGSSLGGVKIGENVNIDENGVISVDLELFKLKDFNITLNNVSIPSIMTDIPNTSINKIVVDLDVIDPTGELGTRFAAASLAKFEVFDAENKRLNVTPVCMFSEGGQKKLSVRFMVAGPDSKTAARIAGAVLLANRVLQ